jgi:prephenate dehydrogenase
MNNMARPDISAERTVAIIGLGLIGGSLARDLASRGARVLGYDRDPESMALAIASGHVHSALRDDLADVADADWLVLAVPVNEAVGILRAIAPVAGHLTLITDVGSTKRAIVDAACELGLTRFVGSHPIAGSHHSGWRASRPGLFTGRDVVLCTAALTSHDALGHAQSLWESLGAVTTISPAEVHDERMAWVSHLPQIASFALALAIGTRGHARAELGPGGRDATRLAASSPAMWRAIGIENAASISRAVMALEQQLRQFRTALDSSDGDDLEARMANASSWCERAATEPHQRNS